MLSILAWLFLSARADAAIIVEPPPGWSDVTAQRRGAAVVSALKGPETSSFLLSRVQNVAFDNRAQVLSFLTDVLAALNRRGAEFTQSSALIAATYGNVTFQYIKASRGGKPRLIIGVIDNGGEILLGTLNSSVPDTMLPSILSGIQGVPKTVRSGVVDGLAVTRDAQLSFSLPFGLVTRDLTESEIKLGFVLALKTSNAELMLLKVTDPATTAAKDQPRIVRQTVLAAAGVDSKSLSSVKKIRTSANTDLIYATARVDDSGPKTEFLAGYMAWGYWGYSVLAKGVDPADLVQETFGTVALGPSASPKLVATTPELTTSAGLDWEVLKGSPLAWGAIALLVVGLGVWRLKML